MLIPALVTDTAAFHPSGTAVCSKYGWNILENWSGQRVTKPIHGYIILILSPHCSMNDPATFAIPLAASMQRVQGNRENLPSPPVTNLVIANILEGCKIIRSADQACRKLYECCLQAFIEINHWLTCNHCCYWLLWCKELSGVCLMLFWRLRQQHETTTPWQPVNTTLKQTQVEFIHLTEVLAFILQSRIARATFSHSRY